MDIKKFQLLLDIAETGNLTESGVRQGYSQSGVSHAIKNLENELGICVLRRTNKGVSLTSEAKAVLPKIRSIVSQYEQLNEIIDELHGIKRGSLIIATYSSISIHWLPKILNKFQAKYPDISIQIKEGGTKEIEGWIQDGVVDFGFYSSFENQKSEFIKLNEDEIFAVLPPNFDCAGYDGFPIKKFNDIPYIASEEGVDFDIADLIASGNINPPVRFCCRDEYSIIAMVSNGMGVTILPGLVIEGFKSRVKTLPLLPKAYRTLGIGMVCESQLSPAAISFIECTKQTLDELIN